jgi:hypothetical protein
VARKVQSGSGTFIKHTNKKRPGRHSKSPNKRSTIEKNITVREEDNECPP